MREEGIGMLPSFSAMLSDTLKHWKKLGCVAGPSPCPLWAIVSTNKNKGVGWDEPSQLWLPGVLV